MCGGDGGGSVVIVVSPLLSLVREHVQKLRQSRVPCAILRRAVAHRSGSMTEQFLREGALALCNKLTTLTLPEAITHL